MKKKHKIKKEPVYHLAVVTKKYKNKPFLAAYSEDNGEAYLVDHNYHKTQIQVTKFDFIRYASHEDMVNLKPELLD